VAFQTDAGFDEVIDMLVRPNGATEPSLEIDGGDGGDGEATRSERPRDPAQDRRPLAEAVLGALPAAVYATDAEGRITFYNDAAAELWSARPQLGDSQWRGFPRLRRPDGRPLAHADSPMAVALNEGRAISGVEVIIERPDGAWTSFLAHPTPLRDADGAVTGAVNMLVPVAEGGRTAELDQRLAAIVEFSNDAIISKNLDGVITSWNQGAERLFGYTADEIVGKPVAVLIPPDRQHEEPAILERLRRGERIDHYETVRRHKDGGAIEISLTVSPIIGAEGKVVGASKIARDIAERKRADERRNLLLKEMNHRVKNLFTLAGGVVSLSARSAETPKALADAVLRRLSAMAQAHDLTLPRLTPGDGLRPTTTLSILVQTIVSPYCDIERGRPGRLVVDGPEAPIGAGAITSVALLLHELTTNAAKYGALSSANGRVEVSWRVDDDYLRLIWRESGGPLLSGEPKTEGFGSLLSRQTVHGQLGGEIRREWNPDGLTVEVSAKLERLAYSA
jgi:PAS domain S-box-containing protein